MKRKLGMGAAVGLLLLAGYVWLALWADHRDHQFFIAQEPRNWGG